MDESAASRNTPEESSRAPKTSKLRRMGQHRESWQFKNLGSAKYADMILSGCPKSC